jgi:hydrogenase nickel incorporation protein HypA/HybF
MHELSIAQGILEIVHQYVPVAQQPRVRRVRISVGDLAGVVPDSLEFGFSALIAGTALRNAALDIVRVPFTLHCKSCNETFSNHVGEVLCPACGGSDATVMSGTELQVSEIELDDDSVEVT